MKKLFAIAAVLALVAAPAFAEEKKAAEPEKKPAACCTKECKGGPKCAVKDGKSTCTKDCPGECCKKAEAKKAS